MTAISLIQKLHNISHGTRVTIAIPLRINHTNTYLLDRLAFPRLDTITPSSFGFMIIDDGSEPSFAHKIEKICNEYNYGYIRLNTTTYNFSIARCRNIAAMHATSRYIMYQDIDLMPYEGFYLDVEDEISIQQLDNDISDFLMFGVVYLTDNGTKMFINCDKKTRKNIFINYLLYDDKNIIEKFSTGTSVNLYDRNYFLSHGGNDEEFEKWGYEDLEFNLRLIISSNKFPHPKNWSLDYTSFQKINIFHGWKSIYRLYGDLTFLKGKVLFHAYHHIDVESDYTKGKKRNRQLFQKKLKDYRIKEKEPAPLPDINKGKTLIFRKNPYVYSRDFIPMLGEVVQANEFDFKTALNFYRYLIENNISRVLFHNPYVNDKMILFYKLCRRINFPYFVAERGALRDSIFFDKNGFNADSKSYNPVYWDNPLTHDQVVAVQNYISQEKNCSISLEYQNKKVGAGALKKKLALDSEKKILFVPLQRPGDTVIKYLCGEIKTYSNFIQLIREISENLPDTWQIIIKEHPLEDDSPNIPLAIHATNENIKDLLTIADAVLLINSGVGVLSMFWEKPVFYTGSVFYAHPEINKPVRTSQELINNLESLFKPNREKIYRFINYLINDFYSFGKMKTKNVRMPDGSRMTATTDIQYYSIRNLTDYHYNKDLTKSCKISTDSILFDRYRGIKDKLFTNHITAQLLDNKVSRILVFVHLRNLHKKLVFLLVNSRFKIFRYLGYMINR